MRCFKIILLIVLCRVPFIWAIDQNVYVSTHRGADRFPLVAEQQAAPLVISSSDYLGVATIAGHLQADIFNVTGITASVVVDEIPESQQVVLIGTLGKSPLIDQLVENRKLNVNGLAGRWDTFVIETIPDPFPGVKQALVIVGSNKRGTFYGMGHQPLEALQQVWKSRFQFV